MSLEEAPRDIRRAVYGWEKSERSSGKWSPWERVGSNEIAANHQKASAIFGGSGGWARMSHTVWRNRWCCVMVRTVANTALGVNVEHASFRTAMNAELSWPEKQRIKDELFGPDRMAVEVYPRTSQLVDEADMYHLWIFPEGFSFDFGLGKDQC